MGTVFNSYGKYYDMLYADKDYEREVDFLEEIFQRYSRYTLRTILDVGCGTGGHAVPLAKRGYEVTGIDVSRVMIDKARENARNNKVEISFDVMDIRKLQLDRRFDVCICMFSVIDYLVKNRDVQYGLCNIRKHLKKEALFIFDFWYGPAVLTILPSVKMKVVEKEGVRVIRFANPHLDILRHRCEVDYYLMVTKGNFIVDEVKEKHVVRFFFPEEIKHFLEESRFRLLKLCAFLDLNADPSEKIWDAIAVSQAM